MLLRIAKDKIYHIIAGAIISVVFGLIFPLWVAWFAVLAAGLGKEIYDSKIKGHYFDSMDVVDTVAGGSVGMLLTCII